MKTHNLFDLTGRAALVTGGGRGIGRELCLGLAGAGADVAVVDILLDNARAVAAEIRASGRRSVALKCDVTRAAQCAAMVRRVARAFGKLDIAVNNAGICINAPAEEMTERDYDTVVDLDLKSVFLCAQAEGRQMIKQGRGGVIINTASMSGSIANHPQPQCAYNAAKAGVILLTKSLASEWAPHGIRVNCISPGYTDTAMTRRVKELYPLWKRDTPMKRLARPEEMRGPVVFLASDAAGFVTGHDLVVDGGFTVW